MSLDEESALATLRRSLRYARALPHSACVTMVNEPKGRASGFSYIYRSLSIERREGI